MVSITTVAAQQLSNSQLAAWADLQRNNAALESPHFTPEFARLVAQQRDGIEVAIFSQQGRVQGFFPYHRDTRHVGRPIAGTFSDFQGLIAAPNFEWEPSQVLRRCGLSAWCFDSLLACQSPAAKYRWAVSESPFLDLSAGFESYRSQRRQAGSRELRETLRKSRKVEREVGPLRLEPCSLDLNALDVLIGWKRTQLRRLRLPDCFADDWVQPLLRQVATCRGERFSGMLSTLHAGDHLLAVNLGMRSGRVFHGWVTAFNREFRKFSPGLLLIVHLAQAAESLGIERIDMGRGDESFKRSFASGAIGVMEGAVDRRWIPRLLTRSWHYAKELVRGTALDAPARRLLARVGH